MVSVIHGTGDRMGAQAEIDQTPKTAFITIREALKNASTAHDAPRHRRFAALFLRSICEWDYTQIGLALGTHRGRAHRMVRKAKEEAAQMILDEGSTPTEESDA